MDSMKEVASAIEDEISCCVDDIKSRIITIRGQLETIESALDDGRFVLNDLGEIQGQASMLDARVATLARMRRLMGKLFAQ
jgi:hypothetical protein